MSEPTATTTADVPAPAPAPAPESSVQSNIQDAQTRTPPHPLGPLLRMKTLEPTKLPAHPDLASLQGSVVTPELSTFISDALAQADSFMREYYPKNFKVQGTSKASPPSTAPVEVLAHEIRPTDLPAETRAAFGNAKAVTENWYARSSIHENAAKPGTATWDELDAGLRADHSLHEKDYTPNMLDAHEVLNWDEPLQAVGNTIGDWTHVQLKLFEMVHRVPAPLKPRLFTVVVVAGKKDKEFLDAQIPIDASQIPKAKYKGDKSLVLGMYTSIEQGTLIENDTKVKWVMGTASDAKGNLPMWAQKLGIGAAVVKDVGYFMDWAEKERKSKA